jgi:hypothetical protein
MEYQNIQQWWRSTSSRYPHLTRENFFRILLLHYGLEYNKQHSYPNPFTRIEIIYTPMRITTTPILTFLRPDSPFHLIEGNAGKKLLFYEDEFLDEVEDYEQRPGNLQAPDPFYFYVREVNGDLVLKLNPVQLCDFFQNPTGALPCSFCFRNDMVQRFRNIEAAELVELVLREEMEKDGLETLRSIDEISIVTGSYPNDAAYLEEVSTLVSGLKPVIAPHLRVVVGSHEGKSAIYKDLQSAGVTVFAFPMESLDDKVRQRDMKNRKGEYPIEQMLEDVGQAHAVFGDDGIIIRLVAGMGDRLDDSFESKISLLSGMGDRGPLWNINQYMPFTHYHWKLFQDHPPYSLDYLFSYMNTINTYVKPDRQMRFKVSP